VSTQPGRKKKRFLRTERQRALGIRRPVLSGARSRAVSEMTAERSTSRVIGRVASVVVAGAAGAIAVDGAVMAARNEAVLGKTGWVVLWSALATAPVVAALVVVAVIRRRGWARVIVPASIVSTVVSAVVIGARIFYTLKDF
jgi:hypothetical protein